MCPKSLVCHNSELGIFPNTASSKLGHGVIVKCDSGPPAAQCGGVKVHVCSSDNSSGRMKGCIQGAPMAVEAKGKEWYLPDQNQLCLIFFVYSS